MTKTEKVVKAFKCCLDGPEFEHDCELAGCPYEGEENCQRTLFTDALEVIQQLTDMVEERYE